jgi:hypothetical protein
VRVQNVQAQVLVQVRVRVRVQKVQALAQVQVRVIVQWMQVPLPVPVGVSGNPNAWPNPCQRRGQTMPPRQCRMCAWPPYPPAQIFVTRKNE